MVMGGSCTIFAAQAAKLGLRVAVLGRIGDDAFGQVILDTLNSTGVDTSYILVDSALKTGLTVHLAQDDDRAMLTYPGSLNALRIEDVTDELLRSARHLHYGSLFLQTGLLPDWVEILRRAKTKGMTISLNTNWDPDEKWDADFNQAFNHIDVLMPNEQEALYLSDQATLESALKILREKVASIVVKRGADGALCWHEDRRISCSLAAADAGGDGVGAGDSFDAGFLAGWLGELPIETCLSIGCQCGRAVASKVGRLAGQPRRADVPELHALDLY